MKLPVLAFGQTVLKQKCLPVKNSPEIQQFIEDLWETMENANGCGLAASQVGKPITLFAVDSQSSFKNMDSEDRMLFFPADDQGIKETFINAEIICFSEETWEDDEGCLSIPGLSKKVKRPWKICIEYLNKDFIPQTRTFSGLTARIIQHEYDHTKGILYLDHLKPLTRKLMEAKLKKIMKGNISISYLMKFNVEFSIYQLTIPLI